MSKFNQDSHAPSAVFADCIANSKQIFQLINSILPAESCLSYGVLPLELNGYILTLGMLDLANQNALDFIHPLAISFGYKLNVKLIDSQTHQLILAAYLKNSLPAQTSDDHRDQTVVDAAPNPLFNKQDWDKTVVDAAPNPPFNKQDWDKTVVDAAPNPPFNKQDWDKTVVDAAPNPSFRDRNIEQKSSVDASMTLSEIPEDFDFALNLVAQTQADQTQADQTDDSQIKQPEIISSEPQISHLIRETDKTPHSNLSDDFDEELSFLNSQTESTDFLSQFTCGELTGRSSFGGNREITPTKISWQELLEKTLASEIDYLQLDKRSDRGVIIARKEEVVKSTLESRNLTIFNSLMKEIKLAAKLPLTPLQSTKKVAMERFHQQERVLLRLEFMPSLSGETVKIQILRDEALKRYEQKQMDKMGEQVLSLAQQLEKTLKKMQICFGSAKLNNLQDLQAIHHKIEHQLQLLDK